MVQLTLHGRSSGSYTVHDLSLVQREGNTVDGVDSSWQVVTFGSQTSVTVPANGTVTSDPIPFDLVAGQDVFLTFYVPAGQPTVNFSGGSGPAVWSKSGTDVSGTIDWASLNPNQQTFSNIYLGETLTVLPSGGPSSQALTVTVGGNGSGTVTSAPSGITCPGDCTEAYPSGMAVTLTASASTGKYL